eukprot:COSAG02_NODE_555_length_20407_cov_11.072878_18_plen_311_part_00
MLLQSPALSLSGASTSLGGPNRSLSAIFGRDTTSANEQMGFGEDAMVDALRNEHSTVVMQHSTALLRTKQVLLHSTSLRCLLLSQRLDLDLCFSDPHNCGRYDVCVLQEHALSLEAASEAHADELQKLLEKAAREMQEVQDKHRERLGKFEADCALQLELREEEQVRKPVPLNESFLSAASSDNCRIVRQDALLQSLAQQHEAKMAQHEAEAARVEETWVCALFVGTVISLKDYLKVLSGITVEYDKTVLPHAQKENHPTKETLALLQQKHDSAMAAAEARHEVRHVNFMRCFGASRSLVGTDWHCGDSN